MIEKRFSVLQEISSAIIVSDDIKGITALILELAANSTNAKQGSILLLTDEGELQTIASIGANGPGSQPHGKMAECRKPALISRNPGQRAGGEMKGHFMSGSRIVCPIVSRNRTLGVLNLVGRKDRSQFSQGEFALVKIMANQAAIALENAFLMARLKTKAAELEAVNDKLVEADRVRTEFLGRISHELRTPLNSINGAIYHLLSPAGVQRAEEDEFHQIIKTETDKLLYTVEGLLDFLRLEEESKVIKKTRLNPAEVAMRLKEMKSLKALLSRNGNRLVIKVPRGLSGFRGDGDLTFKMLLNIAEGASFYLRKKGVLKVNFSEDEGHVKMALNGAGSLPEEALAYMRNPDYPLTPVMPEGIFKLFVAQKAAEAHRWRIEAGRTPSGFEISVRAPRCEKEDAEYCFWQKQ